MVVLELKGLGEAEEGAKSDAQVFDLVDISLDVVFNLEMAASVALGCLLVLGGDHEVVDDLEVASDGLLLAVLLAPNEGKTIEGFAQ